MTDSPIDVSVTTMLPHQRSGVPTSASIQLADRCNHACGHCYQVLGRRGELTTAEVEGILDDMARNGVLFVTFSGGEVTLRADLFELIAYAREKGFAVRVFTNGFLVDDLMASRFAQLGVLEVQISVYSADPSVHDELTRVPGSHARTIAAVRALKHHGVQVVVKTPLMSVNGGTIGEFIALADSLGCGYMVDPTLDIREDGDSGPLRYRPSDADVRGMFADPRFGVDPPGVLPTERPLEDTPCGVCSVAYITSDGTLRPCTALPISLGNLRTTSIGAAYADNAAAQFIQGLRWADLPDCRVCDLRRYCSRCHASALLEDGDLFGPATVSCGIARVRYHYSTGVPETNNEPARGPYLLTDGGRVSARESDPNRPRVPDDVPFALVRGRARSAAPKQARVSLPVLQDSGALITGEGSGR